MPPPPASMYQDPGQREEQLQPEQQHILQEWQNRESAFDYFDAGDNEEAKNAQVPVE